MMRLSNLLPVSFGARRAKRVTQPLAMAVTLLVLLALANWNAPQQHAQQSGCGAPSFVAASNFTTGPNAARLVASDLNLDGRPDLAVLNRNEGNNSLSILLNDGNGGFNSSNISLVNLATANALASGDFNGDGLPEMLVPRQKTPSYFYPF